MTDAPTHEWQIGTEGMRAFGEGRPGFGSLFDVHGQRESSVRGREDGSSYRWDTAGRGAGDRLPRLAG